MFSGMNNTPFSNKVNAFLNGFLIVAFIIYSFSHHIPIYKIIKKIYIKNLKKINIHPENIGPTLWMCVYIAKDFLNSWYFLFRMQISMFAFRQFVKCKGYVSYKNHHLKLFVVMWGKYNEWLAASFRICSSFYNHRLKFLLLGALYL